MRRARFWIDPARESPEFLHLFALLADDAARQARETQGRFEVKPGPLLVWARASPPTPEQLGRGAIGTAAPASWPPDVTRRWASLQGGVFLWGVRRAAVLAPVFGINDGRELCRILAATSQALVIDTPAFREHNAAIVRNHLDAARERLARSRERDVAPPPVEPLEPVTRADEDGVRIETPEHVVLFASHIGPRSGGKLENQDAVDAVAVGSTIAFALADGVGTSLGARSAAITVAREVCRSLRAALSTGADSRTALVAAAAAAQQHLDQMLDRMLEGSALPAIAGDLPASSARRFLENTRTGANLRLPRALATTLVAGCLVPAANSRGFFVTLLRIGDGVVERVTSSGEAEVMLGMDASVTAIDAAIGPGPGGRASLTRAEFATFVLNPGDRLVASSDGLTRGRTDTVWSALTSVAGEIRSSTPPDPKALLDRAAAAGDEAALRQPGSGLFNDNLSLVLVLPRVAG